MFAECITAHIFSKTKYMYMHTLYNYLDPLIYICCVINRRGLACQTNTHTHTHNTTQHTKHTLTAGGDASMSVAPSPIITTLFGMIIRQVESQHTVGNHKHTFCASFSIVQPLSSFPQTDWLAHSHQSQCSHLRYTWKRTHLNTPKLMP